MRSHSRVIRGAALGAVLTGLFASSVSAATTEVAATESKTFSPADVTSAVGGSVHWTGSTTEHSVRQNSGVFDSGAPVAFLDYGRTFSAGTFAYHCTKHGLAMSGRVRVAPQVLAKPAGLPFTVTWATAAANTGNRFDVQYRIGSGAWKKWLGGTTQRSKVFGAKSRPVALKRGKTYSFRVVSKVSSTAKSALSPAKSFRVR